jgi:uncharacterized membrane protein YozB (DUF420 family)
MYSFFEGDGFLTAKSTLGADISLLVMIVAAVMLTVGVVLAKRDEIQAHRWVQTSAATLNALLVLVWMIRSFWLYIRPGLPGELGKATYSVTTVHAVVGALGLLLGAFVVLQGNEVLPKSWRATDFKLFMRIAYVLYMLGTVLGIAVYVVVYR